jgi:two-component system sensor histidine kinase AgrC
MFGLLLITLSLECLRYIIIFNKLLDYPFRKGKLKYLYIVTSLILYSSLSFFDPSIKDSYASSLLVLFVFIAMLVLFNGKLSKLVLSYFIVAFSTVIWDNLIFCFIEKIDVLNVPDTNTALVRMCIFCIASIPFILFISEYINKRRHKFILINGALSPSIYILILICIFITSVIVTFYRSNKLLNYDLTLPNIVIVVISIIYFVLCIALVFLFNSREKYKIINNIREEYMLKQVEYYKAMLSQYEDVRKFRHDFKNHIISIQELLYSDRLETVKEYVNHIYNTYEINTRVFDTGNDILNAFINYYSNLGKEAGIIIQVNGYINNSFSINEMHLCTVISNILSNAYEATLLADEELSKIIEIDIRCGTKFFEITVKNPTRINRPRLTKNITTSKSDKNNHGYGIKNIKDVIKAYDGDFRLIDNADSVTVKASMRIG